MAQNQTTSLNSVELDRLATQLAKDPHSKAFMPLAEEYGKAGMWQEAAAVLEDGLKLYPGFITAMVALGRAYDHLGQFTKAKAILEESVKLSPENLRAHRTLIKIYQSQGLHESALQSCAVILAANPRDEEARSIQSALGGPLKEQKEPARLKPLAPITSNPSTQQTAIPPVSDETTVSAKEASTAPNLPGSTPIAPETPPAISPTQDQEKEHPAVPELDLQPIDTVETPPPSPHADVVAQLEAWLRAIESRRHDHDTTNQSDPRIS
ncbi:MAG: tetratricopeptide repeat protein [Nitrospirae bacterium]|nr:tetratricopeptide repeat protein [Nitrospirota bacterium]